MPICANAALTFYIYRAIWYSLLRRKKFAGCNIGRRQVLRLTITRRKGVKVSEFIYDRVLLKLSGEALMGDAGYGIDPTMLEGVAKQLKDLVDGGLQLAIVVGGGNIFRGLSASAEGMERAQADYIGMLATVMNALALQQALEKQGVTTRVMSAIAMQEVCEPYIRRRAERHLEQGRAVICAAGTGNPYFTTDTAAALRACEVGAQCMLKATKVDGVYDCDPVTHPEAKKFDRISYIDVLTKDIHVMDSTATSLCMDNDMPMIVFNLHEEGSIYRALKGEPVGTVVE